MIQHTIERFAYLCRAVPTLLYDIPATDFDSKPAEEKWSKKEILGHLIDSATNNHHRFIRAQFENVPQITYDQNSWNKFNYYQQIDVSQLIQFWTFYNLQLLKLFTLMPLSSLKKECNTGGSENVTIEWLIIDYVSHLEHHLAQILGTGIEKNAGKKL